jgi:tRNA-specific 2-thiouridylase
VVCNREIKFGLFLTEALAAGADAVATGHYVRRLPDSLNAERYTLNAGLDPDKDQSYFLWQLTPQMVQHAVFPIGHMRKADVRAEAARRGFSTAEKPDSTGICFVGEVPMQEFLERFIAPNPGPVLTSSGKQVGEHKGLHYYTIGQRKGIGVWGGGPVYFVAEKDEERNALVVASPAEEGEVLHTQELLADSLNWIGGSPPEDGIRVLARVRYRQPLQEATLHHEGEDCIRVVFDAPQRAVTPGQSVVFYRGEEMLGGGVISEAVGKRQ